MENVINRQIVVAHDDPRFCTGSSAMAFDVHKYDVRNAQKINHVARPSSLIAWTPRVVRGGIYHLSLD